MGNAVSNTRFPCPLGQLAFRETTYLQKVIDANPSPEIKRELAERFGLTLSAIRCIDSECVRPVSVRVLQARARLFQNVAKKFLDIGASSKPCPFRNECIASVTFSVR